MAALTNELSYLEPKHLYHAVADVFNTKLEQPLTREIERSDAYLKLDPKKGTYQYAPVHEFNIEGILSYKSGYTQVAGHPSSKVVGGFTTLATSVLEGLNVLDVVTADRVVAQISTVHGPFEDDDPVPSVTFLGTRFENLQIAGHPVTVHRALDILGPKPIGKKSYFDDATVAEKIRKQRSDAAKKGLPDWARDSFQPDRPLVSSDGVLECSLVNSVDDAPGESFGHVIDLPHFGKIFLGELKVERKLCDDPADDSYRYIFHLTMIRLDMGCLAKGTANVVTLDANGQGTGGHRGVKKPVG